MFGMGKKGGWISALKKVFTSKSKEKFDTGPDIYVKEKKVGLGRKRYGEVNSFISLYREPSSVEKILSDVEKEQQYKAHPLSYKNLQPQKPPILRQNTSANTSKNVVSVKADSSDRKSIVASYKAKSIIPSKQAIIHNSKSISSNYAHISATKIQAAYRGYMARRSFKTLKALFRLKNMLKGKNVKRQTMITMRSMQFLVRIQTQIHARRLQMMENQNIHQSQISWRSNKDTVSSLNKWNTSNQLEREIYDEWDDSMLTKEEKDVNVKRKVDAVMKRERALAYAYSHQLLTITPKIANATNGVPVWSNWLEHQIPSVSHPGKTPAPPPPRPSSTNTSVSAAYHRSRSHIKPPRTPLYTSTPTPRSRTLHMHNSSNRWQATHARPAIRDDDSLISCPAFATPNYMASTVSAKAKVRATAIEGGKGAKESKRFSFGLNSPNPLRLFSAMKKATPPVVPAKEVGGRHRSTMSIGEMSLDSTISLPVGLGRRAFK